MTFADTSALYAIVDAGDRVHSAASNSLRSLVRRREPMVSTPFVVSELLALTQRRLGMEAVFQIIEKLLPGIELPWDGLTSVYHEALELMHRENRRRLSFVDCTSIVFMRRHEITTAFAYDEDFQDFGIVLL